MKTKQIILSGMFLASIAACKDTTPEGQDDWISGDTGSHDTVVGGNSYRYYHSYWYPIYNNMISPSTYAGSTDNDIARPGYTPAHGGGVETGGFGSSAHGGEGGGE